MASVLKALPRGPVIRYARNVSRTNEPSLIYATDAWNGGRDLHMEEQRAGMLLHNLDVKAMARPRPTAVLKADVGDYQVNELRPSAGAFLTRMRRGRWKKISRATTHLVESDQLPFHDPNKSMNPLTMSHGEYVRRLGNLPAELPLLHFVMYRENQSLHSIRQRFLYEIGVPADALVLHHAPGGHGGCVSQFGTCVGVSREQLLHVNRLYNLHPLVLDPVGHHAAEDFARLSTRPNAFFYRMMLRCVDGKEAEILDGLRRIKSEGFINYFGVEHFGIGSNTFFDVAALEEKQDPRSVIGCVLQLLAEGNPAHHDAFLSYINAEDGTTIGALEQWMKTGAIGSSQRSVRALLDALLAYHTNRGDAAELMSVWRASPLRRRCRGSAAEFVWNAMATQRLLDGGRRVHRGDVIFHAGDGSVRMVNSDEDAAQYDITDVVLPVPYEGSRMEQAIYPRCGRLSAKLYRDFATAHGLSFLCAPSLTEAAAETASPVTYRPVVVKPSRMQASVMQDPTSLASIKTDVFTLQERRPLGSLDLDHDVRVRQPCVYNMSERVAERMECVRRQHRGTNSVAVSFVLEGEDCSPAVALRSQFSLSFAMFHDLCEVEV